MKKNYFYSMLWCTSHIFCTPKSIWQSNSIRYNENTRQNYCICCLFTYLSYTYRKVLKRHFFFHLKEYKLEITFSWRNTYPTNFKEACNNPASQLKLNISLSSWLTIYIALFETLPLLFSRPFPTVAFKESSFQSFSFSAFHHDLLIHCTLKNWAGQC